MSILTSNSGLNKFFLGLLLTVAVLPIAAACPAWSASFSVQAETKVDSKVSGTQAPPAREDRFMGTGNSSTGGFSSTYTDPQTGDIVTRVVPPAQQNLHQSPVPIYIYPQVEPNWPPQNSARPRPVLPQDPYTPVRPSGPSLFSPDGR